MSLFHDDEDEVTLPKQVKKLEKQLSELSKRVDATVNGDSSTELTKFTEKD